MNTRTQQLQDAANILASETDKLTFGGKVNHVYNPLIYAKETHLDYIKKYGAGKKSYEFETELDELFANDPIVKPVLTLSSTDDEKTSASGTNKSEDDDIVTQKPAKISRKTSSADITDTIKQYLQESKQRH